MTRKWTALATLVLMLSPALAAAQAMSVGKEHLRRDEYGLAVKTFTSYIEQYPHKSLPYELRACAYLRMDSLGLALKDIAKTQQVDTSEQTGSFANWLAGIAWLFQGNATTADSLFSKATVGSPSVAGQRIAQARQNTDSLFVGDSVNEQSSEQYRQRLGGLLLDEFIDYQLFGTK
ncbi:MAG TPA: hypothetical protein VMH22_04945 [bacterium]|nr:hypothetical protein [bacterium]